ARGADPRRPASSARRASLRPLAGPARSPRAAAPAPGRRRPRSTGPRMARRGPPDWVLRSPPRILRTRWAEPAWWAEFRLDREGEEPVAADRQLVAVAQAAPLHPLPLGEGAGGAAGGARP